MFKRYFKGFFKAKKFNFEMYRDNLNHYHMTNAWSDPEDEVDYAIASHWGNTGTYTINKKQSAAIRTAQIKRLSKTTDWYINPEASAKRKTL